MEVYTYQIAKWRLVKKMDGVKAIDTTIKTGFKQLAPTWTMVLGIKDKSLSSEKYTQMYHDMLECSRKAHPAFWEALFRQEKIALGCYCKPDTFCHRYLLVAYLEAHANAKYKGEIL